MRMKVPVVLEFGTAGFRFRPYYSAWQWEQRSNHAPDSMLVTELHSNGDLTTSFFRLSL